jgi:hypothetical protein
MASKHSWRALISACLFFLAPAFAAEEAPLSMYVGGELVIGTDGHVRTCKVTSGTPAIKALVARSVEKWTFEPILRDGAAIEARTAFSLKLVATPTEQAYTVRVSEAPDFYVPRKVLRHPVPLSPEFVGHGDFDVLAAMRVDREGKVTDAAVLAVQSGGTDVKIRGLERFVQQTLKHWKYEPALPVDRETFEGLITFSVRQTTGRNATDAWRQPVFSNPKRIPWSDAPADARHLQDGQMVAMDPAVKLKTPLAGTVL